MRLPGLLLAVCLAACGGGAAPPVARNRPANPVFQGPNGTFNARCERFAADSVTVFVYSDPNAPAVFGVVVASAGARRAFIGAAAPC